MISSLNPFGGLSAANLLTLLGANSASWSQSTTSSSTPQSAPTGAPAADANDPAKAIKAILAQAQVEPSAGGSVSVTTVQAAYAAQTRWSSPLVSAMISSAVGAGSELDNGVSANASSLLVGTASGAVSVTMGDASQILMDDRASQALESYQALSQQLAQEDRAASSSFASAINATSAPAPSGSDLGYLQLGISAIASNSDTNAYIEAQAQQLITAFENSALGSTSNNTTGFSFASSYNGSSFIITGIEVHASHVLGGGMAPITKVTTESNPDFKDLINQSVAMGGTGGYAAHECLGFAIPLGNT